MSADRSRHAGLVDPLGRATAARSALVSLGTVFVLVSLAVLPLLTPWFVHPALDVAGAPERLGLDAAASFELSDRSVEELVLGPGAFAFAGPDGRPFYDEAERAHLRDARMLLWATLGLGTLSAIFLGLDAWRSRGSRAVRFWRAVSRGGIVTSGGVLVLGIAGVVAFGTLFDLFHQVLFPAGNWSFDPATQRLVQLYPMPFWQLAATVLGIVTALLGLATWWLAGRIAIGVMGRGTEPRGSTR